MSFFFAPSVSTPSKFQTGLEQIMPKNPMKQRTFLRLVHNRVIDHGLVSRSVSVLDTYTGLKQRQNQLIGHHRCLKDEKYC